MKRDRKAANAADPAKVGSERMHTSREVYDRIKWDARFDAGEFLIGYADRARPEPKEVAFRDFVPDGDIPWHRIYYFRSRTAGILWDRRTRRDAIFHPGAAAASPAGAGDAEPAVTVVSTVAPRAEHARTPYRFDPLEGAWVPAALHEPPSEASGGGAVFTVATLNVLCDLHEADLIDTAARTPAALAQLRACDADVIALVEVTPAFLAALCEAPWVREGYVLSDAVPDGASVTPLGQLLMSRAPFAWVTQADFAGSHKKVISAGLSVGGCPLVVSAVHLSSDRGGGAGTRASQLEQLAGHVAPPAEVPWLVLGDFNLRDDEAAVSDVALTTRAGLEDLWPALRAGEPGDTFDPGRNPLAELLSRTGRAARFDRMYVRAGAADLRGLAIELFAEEPMTDHPASLPVSDHFGLRARLAIGAGGLGAVPPGGGAAAATTIPERLVVDAPPTYRSALVVALPERVAAPVQAIRKRHDRGYARWMPHITLVYGFVDEAHFAAAARAVSRAVEGLAPFDVTLARFDQFEHDGSSTVFLRPEVVVTSATPPDALVRLQAALQPSFPQCGEQSRKSPAGFTPHLTVARFARAQAAECARAVAQWQRAWDPVRFTVDRVELISRRGAAGATPPSRGAAPSAEEPFASRVTVMLGTGEVRAHDTAVATSGGDDDALAAALAGAEAHGGDGALAAAFERIAAACRACAERPPDATSAEWSAVEPIGSFRMGLATAGSDLDVVAFGAAPREAFHARLTAALEGAAPEVAGVHVVDTAVVPVVRCTVAPGVRVEVQYAQWPAALPAVHPESLDARDLAAFEPASARAAAAVRDAAAVLAAVAPGGPDAVARFVQVARAVKRWARARQVDAHAFGYPGGYGWTVVAAHACLHAPASVAAVLEWLFDDLAARDWQRAPLALAPAHASGFAAAPPRDAMPVLTPAAPHRNIARNATRATREVVRREAVRARDLVRDARRNRASWDAWLAPLDPAAEPAIELVLAGDADGRGAGYVEGRFVGLLLALERAAGPGAVRPYTRREARGDGAWAWRVGVARPDAPAVRAAVSAFERAYAQWVQRPAGSALRRGG